MRAGLMLVAVMLLSMDTWAGELPVLKVQAGPRTAFAPKEIKLVVIARPDAKNRALAIGIGAQDSAWATSSIRRLHGEQEQGQLVDVTYPGVPAGNYLVVVTLFDQQGKQIAQRSADIRRIGRR